MKIKTKLNKWDLVKLKSICTGKETINWKNKYKKIQPTEWEKILTNNATHKGLIPKYTDSLFSSMSKNKQPNQDMGRQSK